jgi:hypothetical protein
MHEVCAQVVADMGDVYPELRERASVIENVTLEEERRFRKTLDQGLGLLEDEFTRMRGAGETVVGGKVTFTLYDTHGFPDDLTEIIAEERGYTVDRAGFKTELAAARERSGFGGSGEGKIATRVPHAGQRAGRHHVPRLRRHRRPRRGARAPGRWRAGRPRVDRRPGRGGPRSHAVLRRERRPDRRRRRAHHRRRRPGARRAHRQAGARSVRPPRRGGGRRARGRRRGRRPGRRRAPRSRARQPLGDPPAQPRAQDRAGRSRRAEGLAGRARSPALRLRALRADDRRPAPHRRGSGQRRDPPQQRLGDRGAADRGRQAARRGRDVRREVRRRRAHRAHRRRLAGVLRRHPRAPRR